MRHRKMRSYHTGTCDLCLEESLCCRVVCMPQRTLVEKWTELRQLCLACRRSHKGKYRYPKEEADA